jgi:transcriptional regulator with GAF, ATPase, and Fis domain
MIMLSAADEFFRQSTLKICGSLEIDSAMGECFQFFKTVFPLTEMGLHIYDREAGVISTLVGADERGGRLFEPPQMIKMSPEAMATLSGTSLSDVRIVNVPVMDQVTREIGEVRGQQASSLLIMRLTVGGERMGALTLRADGLNRYSEEDARLLSSVNQPFGIALSNSLRYRQLLRLQALLHDDKSFLNRELLHFSGEEVIGGEFGLKNVMELVRRVAPLSSPVLLLGETGVGKEVIAAAIHYSSTRKDGPFIKVNCGALPEGLVESELFGHEKGAFTGAIAQKRGLFERADQGTLFLDEIGELPLSAQVKLLRVLQTREVERVGGSRPLALDIRILAATHRDLGKMIEGGTFREDLWFRLNVFPIVIPPLRDRRADIPALVQYFVEMKSKELGRREFPLLASEGLERLMHYSWPGNVRELENLVERALILNQGEPLSFSELLFGKRIAAPEEKGEIPTGSEDVSSLNLDQAMEHHIQRVLKLTWGKVQGPGGAAELLGINASTLRNRMKRLAVPYGRGTKHKAEF